MQADLKRQEQWDSKAGFEAVPGEYKPASDGYFVLYIGKPKLQS
jgi:hypothetical protein